MGEPVVPLLSVSSVKLPRRQIIIGSGSNTILLLR